MSYSYISTLGESHLAHKNKEKELVVHKPSPALLSFEDVCSVWSVKIRHRFDESDKPMMSTRYKHCLVDEFWGFNRRHARLIPFPGLWTCVRTYHGKDFPRERIKHEL